MKKTVFILAIFSSLTVFSKTENLKSTESLKENIYYVPTQEEVEYVYPLQMFSPYLGRTFLGFKDAVALSESSCNYFVVNRLGYKGRYQFGNSTLKWVGITNPTKFLRSPKLQERAFEALVAKNKFLLRNHLAKFEGKIIGGVKITESGLIAAAHLGGAGNVKKFLDSNGKNVFADGNGIAITTYMKKFSNYDISIINANRLATARS
ncbi:MAG TPA: peptidoglycan-binding protein LysM [Salinimicrobium sp.]|nr:peptidoglycan-binding protein LysM [Salinimicrobium sp.]